MHKSMPAIVLEGAFFVSLIVVSLQPSHASIPCPVSFLDGKLDTDGISLSFRNKGKLPIQEFEIACGLLGPHKSNHARCYEQAGLFFPGNSYDLKFLYPLVSERPVQPSLQSARLADGSVWHANRDQMCRPLKIGAPRNPRVNEPK